MATSMQIFVLTDKTLTLEVKPSDTIANVKTRINFKRRFWTKYELGYAGKILKEELTLRDYNIPKEATIHLLMGLRGGGKKRKKKNYTTPKKTKHTKKTEPLSVLKCYTVDDNGKVTRLRRECPNKDCGAGVFMASHFDRQTCGKCGLTYVFNKPEDVPEDA